VARREPDRLVASPLKRAAETARAVSEACGLQVETIPELQEISFGRWEGKTFDEIQEAEPELVEQMSSDPENFAFPEGESMEEFWDRVAGVGDRLADGPAGCTAVVSHGGVTRGLICHFLGLPPTKYLLFDVDLASISAIRLHDRGGVLCELNNTTHLEAD
jgi:broad specificity phosphatase PhoE